MSGSKGPHYGPILLLDACRLYTLVTLASFRVISPTVGCWKDSGKHRGLARRLWPPCCLGPRNHILLNGCSRSVALLHPGIPWRLIMAPSFARSSRLHRSFQSKAGTAAGKPRPFQIKECSVSRMCASCTV